MKKIVVIGGGSGTFNVLKGLKHYPVDITAVVTTFDNGGSTGILRDEFGMLPSGDIRRSLIALSPETGNSTLRDLFNFRFKNNSSLRGHSFGNLFLQALTSITGNEIGAIKKASEILNIKGKVLPISIDDANVCAELENGKIIRGETNIDIPKHNGAIKIKSLYLEPQATIYEEAHRAIVDADLIVFGPGDLYTSIIPNVLVNGFADALNQSKAKLLYITNLMTKWGETNGFVASDFSRILLSYLKKNKFDYVICDSSKFSDTLIKKYEEEKSFPVLIDKIKLKKYAETIILDKVSYQSDIIRHDAKKLSRVMLKIF
ncbi:MAG: hypothetical protein COV30_00880 [Candidatus Yanofskybacteria bacterium CG10_big_fil_rev_8_21_14_0_10_37_15]|uniref:Putative gluconeogenesis factor n=1 Tax=Candidatus Yanofskybacteria bacterium CG10_big_fil_rev_8_21_14_0_10_37_15 TaxID=1975097 RepID=A0A2H0R6I9_9BACT|nr:MAG: hypothetical protein COV30_00880 [Candidatus Yanofskybacteria bacterium CG10_big_fil_rev_8_21_14_0_10_37_15]